MAEEKVAPPTQRRRQEAHRRGMVALSTDLVGVAGLAAGGLALYWGGVGLLRGFEGLLAAGIGRPPAEPEALWGLLGNQLGQGLLLAAPPVLAAGGAGVGVGLLQTGGAFSFYPLRPDLGRLDPIAGLRRLASRRGLVELARSAFKAGAVGLVVYFTLAPRLFELAFWSAGPLEGGLGGLWAVASDLFFRGLIGLGVLGLLDYAYRLWRHERDLRMTRSELKEELRQTEGDPTIRLQLRRRHRQLAFRNMMAAVPKADVVVTNPTHLAVALGYDPKTMGAPRVVAKGRGLVAERIRTLARQAGVPVVSNPPLAQALYRAVEVGMEIPPALYQAVAELLAYIYRLRELRRTHGG